MKTKKRFLNERGVSSIEMVLVLPVLLPILFGIVEYGWLFKTQMDLDNAVSQGARVAVKEKTAASAINAMQEVLSDDFSKGIATVTNLEDPSRVRVVFHSFSHQPLTGFFPSALLPSTLSATAVMAYP